MSGWRAVARLLLARAVRDGAGVGIRRIAGAAAELDPFLLLDEFGSDDPDDYLAGFPEHPHRGFETVTYMLAGHMEHRDSNGGHGRLGPGDVQWMTAGRGIIHSEMPLQERGRMRGFQLWVNLPARAKMVAPRYREVAAAEIPVVAHEGVQVRVIAGQYRGTRGAVEGIVTDPTYLDVALKAGAVLEHAPPDGHTVLLYLYEGGAWIGAGPAPIEVSAGTGALLDAHGTVRVEAAAAPARLLLLAGRPIGEPVVQHGPFVMNTREEIERAIADYRSGRLAG